MIMLSLSILPKIIKVKFVVMSRWQGVSNLWQGVVEKRERGGREGRGGEGRGDGSTHNYIHIYIRTHGLK